MILKRCLAILVYDLVCHVICHRINHDENSQKTSSWNVCNKFNFKFEWVSSSGVQLAQKVHRKKVKDNRSLGHILRLWLSVACSIVSLQNLLKTQCNIEISIRVVIFLGISRDMKTLWCRRLIRAESAVRLQVLQIVIINQYSILRHARLAIKIY